MVIQNRNGVVFVVCLLTLALSGSAQQRAKVDLPAYVGEPLTLKCETKDVGSIDRCIWGVIKGEKLDRLGKDLNKDTPKDNPKPRFETSLDFEKGVCQLYISALEPSDFASYACNIQNRENVSFVTERFVLEDIPKDFSIEYDGELYRDDQTLTEVRSGIRFLLNCSAGPSIQIATLDWSIEPSNGEQSANQIVGPEGVQTIISGILVSLDAANKRSLNATCSATHPGYVGGTKTITLTLITSDDVPPTSRPRPSTTVGSVEATSSTGGPTESPGFRREKYGFFYINEVIRRIKRSLKKEAPAE